MHLASATDEDATLSSALVSAFVMTSGLPAVLIPSVPLNTPVVPSGREYVAWLVVLDNLMTGDSSVVPPSDETHPEAPKSAPSPTMKTRLVRVNFMTISP